MLAPFYSLPIEPIIVAFLLQYSEKISFFVATKLISLYYTENKIQREDTEKDTENTNRS